MQYFSLQLSIAKIKQVISQSVESDALLEQALTPLFARLDSYFSRLADTHPASLQEQLLHIEWLQRDGKER